MVQSVTVFDEDVTEEDMTSFLDWQAEKNNTCSCGQPFDESTAYGADYDYEAELVTCHACAAMDRKERAFREQQNAVMDGLKRRVRHEPD